MKGKFWIKQIENVILFKVLEMDERFRALTDIGFGHEYAPKAKNLLHVNSFDHPEICSFSVALRGKDKSKDNLVVTLEFESIDKAAQYKNILVESLKDWAENWTWWDRKEEKEYDYEREIFEV